jgi:hypothetical protein
MGLGLVIVAFHLPCLEPKCTSSATRKLVTAWTCLYYLPSAGQFRASLSSPIQLSNQPALMSASHPGSSLSRHHSDTTQTAPSSPSRPPSSTRSTSAQLSLT